MQAALEEAMRAGDEGEVPVGAVLVCEGRIAARGRNRPIGLNDPTGHAEILALRAGAAAFGNYRLPSCVLYVTLEPCVMCAGAILQARIGRLIYGTDDPKGGGVQSLYGILSDPRLNHRVGVKRGVREEECREILRRFFRERR
jgi:tRNA(adenine34) deaminase